jgi:hypothetical protein
MVARPGLAPAGTRFLPPGRFGNPAFVNSRFRHHHHHHPFITSGCFGNPYLCSGFYYPYSFYPYSFLDYPLFGPDMGYTQQQQYPVVQQTFDDTALRDQIDQLTGEVEQLRQEEQARQAPPNRSAAQPVTPTVLVFRDGRRAEVQNYAIAGQTLWVFNERQAKKYPLSDLDLAATTAANEQRGIEFSVPSR